MASRGLLQLVSYFTLSLSLLVLIFALSSHLATASSSSSSSSILTESTTTISKTGRSTQWIWDHWSFPKDWFRKSLKDILSFLNKVRDRILDEMLRILGLPGTGDVFNFLVKALRWLGDKLAYFISDPRARVDTAIEWIVDSIMNPFKTLKDGMLSFRRLFRYLHKLRKGTYADFGKDNPVYKCFIEFYPGCVKDTAYSVGSFVTYHFYCAWLFYEKCQLHFFWENGMYKVPRVNGGDPCKVLPQKKCADQPPI